MRPATAAYDRIVVVTQPEPWAIVRPQLARTPGTVVFAGDLSRSNLDDLAASITEADAVIGIGGGSAIDTAKWIHWRRDIPLVQVPTLPSVDACFTRMVALRERGTVVYEGDAVPEVVLVDFEVMAAAPPPLLAAGIGDVLSCHTARFDWALAAAAGHEPAWDDDAAAASLRYVDALSHLAPALSRSEDLGLLQLMECLRDIGWRCRQLGHARFEEGSEHFFAYAFEALTGRTIMHGELVIVGALAMSTLQDNEAERVRGIVAAAGARSNPDVLGISPRELVETLRMLPRFVREHSLWYSILDSLVIGDREVEMVLGALRA